MRSIPRTGSANPLDVFLKWDRKKQLIAGGAAAGLIVILIIGVAMLMRRGKAPRAGTVSSPAAIAAGEGEQSTGTGGSSGVEQQIESKLMERDALQQKADQQALQALKVAPVITKTSEVLAKHIREKVAKESELSAQILRTWIREEEED